MLTRRALLADFLLALGDSIQRRGQGLAGVCLSSPAEGLFSPWQIFFPKLLLDLRNFSCSQPHSLQRTLDVYYSKGLCLAQWLQILSTHFLFPRMPRKPQQHHLLSPTHASKLTTSPKPEFPMPWPGRKGVARLQWGHSPETLP